MHAHLVQRCRQGVDVVAQRPDHGAQLQHSLILWGRVAVAQFDVEGVAGTLS